MFDITPDDINQLNDPDLRELVGRFCEAERVSCGLSAAEVTWGGNQTAADGGLDVRVALPPRVSIEGFVPRPSTGFQVKTPDMPRAAILPEMRPAGAIRPVIQERADEAGAYVIVSSKGSTADSALRNRRDALREALDGIANADQLHTDRTRLATWVRRHPGLITWVKRGVGRGLVGWHPTDEREAKEASDTLVSLFTIYLSGTHATVEQRLGVIERLLRSAEAQSLALGLAALGKVLEATHFSSSYRFEFGTRSRDFGYQPRSDADVTRWSWSRPRVGRALGPDRRGAEARATRPTGEELPRYVDVGAHAR